MDSSVEQFIIVLSMIPAVVILAILGVIAIKMLLGHQERKAKIRAEALAAGNNTIHAEIDALRHELARLRDTCTQYDVSIQQTLEELQHRLERLESRHPAAASAEENKEQITQGRRAI